MRRKFTWTQRERKKQELYVVSCDLDLVNARMKWEKNKIDLHPVRKNNILTTPERNNAKEFGPFGILRKSKLYNESVTLQNDEETTYIAQRLLDRLSRALQKSY